MYLNVLPCTDETINSLPLNGLNLFLHEFNRFTGNKINFYNIDQIDTIAEAYVYFVPVKGGGHLSYWEKNFNTVFEIPSKVVEDIKNNKAKVVIWSPSEADGFAIDRRVEFILKEANHYGLKPEDFIYIDCNSKNKEYLKQYNIHGITLNEYRLGDNVTKDTLNGNINININSEQILQSIKNKNLRQYKYLCFNRCPKKYRMLLVDKLIQKKLDQNALITFPAINPYLEDQNMLNLFKFYKKLAKNAYKNSQQIRSTYTWDHSVDSALVAMASAGWI